MNELHIFSWFSLGFVIGGLSCWDLVKRYKRAQGYNADPLDGRYPTPLEKLVENNKDKLKESYEH